MKKRATSLLLALALAAGLTLPAAAAGGTAYASTQSVNVDGKAVEFQMYAIKDANGNDTNYVKVRDVAQALNGTKAQFSVGWDGAVDLVPGQGYAPNGTEMTTPYSGDRAYTLPTAATKVNGQAAALDAIVLTDDAGGGYTYYKLRDLGTALGFTVDWSADKGVFITTGGAATPDPASIHTPMRTAADLEGVWCADILGFGTLEYTFSGDQLTEITYKKSSDGTEKLIHRTGPFTMTSAAVDGDENVRRLDLDWSYEEIAGDTKEGFYPGESRTSTRKLVTNLNVKPQCFLYMGGTFTRSEPKYQALFDAAMAAQGGLTELEPVYDFLADYIQTVGKLVTYGDYKDQYRVALDLYNELGTNTDWIYSLYADPATKDLTLKASIGGSMDIGYGGGSVTSLTVTLPYGSTGPFPVEFRSTYSVDVGWTYMGSDQSASMSLDPATFTRQTEELVFTTTEGFSDYDSQKFDQKNSAVNLQIMLKALKREILADNGYVLADLGFTSF